MYSKKGSAKEREEYVKKNGFSIMVAQERRERGYDISS